MTQLERIAYMEKLLDEGNAAIKALSDAIEAYKAAIPGMDELIAYYTGKQWMQDFNDDTAGKIPNDIKRGVLSEDSVYDLISDRAAIEKELRSI